MRNSDIIRPLCIPQHPLLHHPSLLAQYALARVCQCAQDNLVKLFDSRFDVLIAKVGIVEVFRLTALSEGHFDGGGTRVDLDQFGIEPDLYRSASWHSCKPPPAMTHDASIRLLHRTNAVPLLSLIHSKTSTATNLDALLLHILLPSGIKLGTLREDHHGR